MCGGTGGVLWSSPAWMLSRGDNFRRLPHLYILHGARLRHAQHVEQLQDQLLDVLQGILLRREVRMDLLLHLNIGDKCVEMSETV